MVKKMLLGATVNQLLDDLSPEIPEGKQPEIENKISLKLNSVLGKNWALMPVTGPYMMIIVLMLNYLLIPMGITPVHIADKAISKGKNMELDHKFTDLMTSAKATAKTSGDFTTEKVRELTTYSEAKGKELGAVLKDLAEDGFKLSKQALSKGKSTGNSIFSSIKSRLSKQNEDTKEPES